MNEYGPDAWNVGKRASIIHIDDYPCDIDNYYQPETELHGSIEDTLHVTTLVFDRREVTQLKLRQAKKIASSTKMLAINVLCNCSARELGSNQID